jgi:hypothetical protein
MPLRLALTLLALASCGRTSLEEVDVPPGETRATGGRVGTGGTRGTSSTGGAGGTVGSGIPCGSAGIVASLEDFESKFLAPRCGGSQCHGMVFPPTNLDRAERARSALNGKQGKLFCKNDDYINRSDPAKSYLLAVVSAKGNEVTCPSGGKGGTRMPNRDRMPTVEGDRLTDEELKCVAWYVTTVAARPL